MDNSSNLVSQFDEDGDASLDWQEFLNTEESEDVDRISQSIDAAMDEIMEVAIFELVLNILKLNIYNPRGSNGS